MTTPTRCAIVGTAPSWIRTPWDDPGLWITSLNDAYVNGLPRVNEYYELHPIKDFWYRKLDVKQVDPRTIPKGAYIRPDGHLAKLQEMARVIPVWLQDEPPDGWPPNAGRLPKEQLDARFGTYWASGPSYIMMHLWARGFREFQVFGIHLSTEAEYREQRPNFEFLLGRLLGADATMRIDAARQWRIWESPQCRIVFPTESPILQHGWQYGYEHRPPHPQQALKDELARVQTEKTQLMQQLLLTPMERRVARLARTKDLEVIEADILNQLNKRHLQEVPLAAVELVPAGVVTHAG